MIILWTDRSRELEIKGSNFIELSKQASSCTKESGSFGAKFSRHLLIWWGKSMQWRPLLPKEGGIDPGGYQWPPTYSTGSKKNFHFGSFFHSVTETCIFLIQLFRTIYISPKTKIVCKSYNFVKFMYYLTPTGLTWLLVLHLLGLGFWMSRVLELIFIVKFPSEPHCTHVLANYHSRHISSQR